MKEETLLLLERLQANGEAYGELLNWLLTYVPNMASTDENRVLWNKIVECTMKLEANDGITAKIEPDTYADISEDYVLQVKGQEGLS